MRNRVCETSDKYGSGFHVDGHRADFPQVFLKAVVVLPDAGIQLGEFAAQPDFMLGRDAEPSEAPVILDTYANTSSAGSIIAFHKYQDDLAPGSLGVICSFGAGYSIGCVVVRKR